MNLSTSQKAQDLPRFNGNVVTVVKVVGRRNSRERSLTKEIKVHFNSLSKYFEVPIAQYRIPNTERNFQYHAQLCIIADCLGQVVDFLILP